MGNSESKYGPPKSYSKVPSEMRISVTRSKGTSGKAQYGMQDLKHSKPDIVLFRWPLSTFGMVGSAIFHSISSSIDLKIHGQPLKIHNSMLSSTYTFYAPMVGELCWKNGWTSTKLRLYDQAGRELAHIQGSGLFSSKGPNLKVMVPCSDQLLDLIVLSGVAILKSEEEAGAGGGG